MGAKRRVAAARAERPISLDGFNLRYAPNNEQGVVYLFAEMAKRWRLRVDEIKAGYPDCIAYRRLRGSEQRIRIEFEFQSRNFVQHGHDPKGCDWIVCWEHNWPAIPPGIEVVELRALLGLGFNVWLQPLSPDRAERIAMMRRYEWSVPSLANKGDLLLFYVTRPESAIRFIYRLEERATRKRARWKEGADDYMARIAPVAELKSPVFREDLLKDRILRSASFVRAQMQGRPNVMDYWPYLYPMIISRNKSLQQKLGKYGPENLDSWRVYAPGTSR